MKPPANIPAQFCFPESVTVSKGKSREECHIVDECKKVCLNENHYHSYLKTDVITDNIGTPLQDTPLFVREDDSTRQVNSADLLGNRDALTIRHQGECYILRQTRAGKLILTK